MEEYMGVKGGQGHSAKDVIWSALVFAGCLFAGIVILVIKGLILP